MDQVVKNNNAAVFELGKTKLTDGQLALLVLIKKSVENKKPIEESEICELYEKHILGTREYQASRYNFDTEEWYLVPSLYQDYEIKIKAKQWLKLNLGALIIKAKLVVIPIIDIDL